MSRWKRVAVSFACALVAEVIMSAVLCLVEYGRDAKLEGFALFSAMELLLVIPCWLLALPIVVLLDRLIGWRLWLFAMVGTLIGPVVMLAWIIFYLKENFTTLDVETVRFLWTATGVSFLTTVIYITTVKATHHRMLHSNTA